MSEETRSARWLRALVAPLVAGLLRAFAATWRVEIRGTQNPFRPRAPRPLLYGLWHENALLTAGVYRDRGVHVAVSRSRDGVPAAASVTANENVACPGIATGNPST